MVDLEYLYDTHALLAAAYFDTEDEELKELLKKQGQLTYKLIQQHQEEE